MIHREGEPVGKKGDANAEQPSCSLDVLHINRSSERPFVLSLFHGVSLSSRVAVRSELLWQIRQERSQNALIPLSVRLGTELCRTGPNRTATV